MNLAEFLDRVFVGDCSSLLGQLPPESVDAVITDPPFGTLQNQVYDSSTDLAGGNPAKHWAWLGPIIELCRQALKPNGILAVSQAVSFSHLYSAWFGPHRIWTLGRQAQARHRLRASIWLVQTKEQQPIRFPDVDNLIPIKKWPSNVQHPCPKPIEEMAFLISHLTQPNQIVLDPFCGIGSTLLAAKQLNRHWIGCDISQRYCNLAITKLNSSRYKL